MSLTLGEFLEGWIVFVVTILYVDWILPIGEREHAHSRAGRQAGKGIEQKAATSEATHHSSLRSDAFVHRYRTIAEKTQQLPQG